MKRKYTLIAIGIAVVFWLLDVCIHYYLYGEADMELIPSDDNELSMRLIIVGLIILFGVYTDYSTYKLTFKERQLEAARIYHSMIHASHHIINNLLNQMILFREEAQRSRDFDPRLLELYDEAMREASDLIKRLSEVERINEKEIWESVKPDSKPGSPTTD